MFYALYVNARVEYLLCVLCTRTYPSSRRINILAVGIVFRMLKGAAKHHVLPDFAKDINDNEQMNEWLLLHSIDAPFTSVGTLLSINPVR